MRLHSANETILYNMCKLLTYTIQQLTMYVQQNKEQNSIFYGILRT